MSSIVGARCAGTAAAAPLARAGRRVVRARPHALPLRPALHARRCSRAAPASSRSIGALPRDPRAELRRTIRVGRGSRPRDAMCHERLRPADDGTDFGALRPARPAGRRARRGGARAGRRGPRGLHGRRRSSGAPAAPAGCATATPTAATREIRATARRSAPTAGARPSRRWSAPWTPYRRLAQRPRPGLPLPRRPAARATRDAEIERQWREGDSFAFALPERRPTGGS